MKRLLCAAILAACSSSHVKAVALAAAAPPTARELAFRFAPVFVQETSARQGDGKEFEDYFVRMDFDSDANGFDNWENLSSCSSAKCDLKAFVYCAVRETDKNYYLHYSYFHPRDPKLFFNHENDLEGAMVVVRKRGDGKPLDGSNIALVQAQAHNRWKYWKSKQYCMLGDNQPLSGALCGQRLPPQPGATHVVLVSQVGRNWWFDQGHGTEIPSDLDGIGDFIAYVPWTKNGKPPLDSSEAEVPQAASGAPPVAYALLPFSGDMNGDGTLDDPGPFGDAPAAGPWDRRRDLRIYGENELPWGHGLQSDDGCKANTPWGWTGDKVPKGTFFTSPTKGEAFAKLKKQGLDEDDGASFEDDPYDKDSDLHLFPPIPLKLKCDCKAMEAAFKSASTSNDELDLGTPCPSEMPKMYTEEDRVTSARLFDACDELRAWAPEQAQRLVVARQLGDECVLQVPSGVLLRWPPLADELRNGRGPGLWLETGERIAGVRLHARASSEPVPLGGFFLQAGREYNESLEDVSWLRSVQLRRDWQLVTFFLKESLNAEAVRPLSAAVIFPDLSQQLASPEGAFDVPPGPPWEVRRIELLTEKDK